MPNVRAKSVQRRKFITVNIYIKKKISIKQPNTTSQRARKRTN